MFRRFARFHRRPYDNRSHIPPFRLGNENGFLQPADRDGHTNLTPWVPPVAPLPPVFPVHASAPPQTQQQPVSAEAIASEVIAADTNVLGVPEGVPERVPEAIPEAAPEELPEKAPAPEVSSSEESLPEENPSPDDETSEPTPGPKRRRRPAARRRAKRPVKSTRRRIQSRPSRGLSANSHHTRHCIICHHPERDAIEEEFLHWHSPDTIAAGFKVPWRGIYRHAHAFNLFERRDRDLRFALGHIIERAQRVRTTADSVIRAVHAYTRINSSGQWVEPPSHVIVSSGSPIYNGAPQPNGRGSRSTALALQTLALRETDPVAPLETEIPPVSITDAPNSAPERTYEDDPDAIEINRTQPIYEAPFTE
jgi:hypothetical protein